MLGFDSLSSNSIASSPSYTDAIAYAQDGVLSTLLTNSVDVLAAANFVAVTTASGVAVTSVDTTAFANFELSGVDSANLLNSVTPEVVTFLTGESSPAQLGNVDFVALANFTLNDVLTGVEVTSVDFEALAFTDVTGESTTIELDSVTANGLALVADTGGFEILARLRPVIAGISLNYTASGVEAEGTIADPITWGRTPSEKIDIIWTDINA